MGHLESFEVFQRLKPEDRVQLVHAVKVGFRNWSKKTVGTVVKTERRRHGLHYQRNQDAPVFSDVLVITRDDGEVTTLTCDDFCELTLLET